MYLVGCKTLLNFNFMFNTVSLCHYFTHGNVLILISALVVLYNWPSRMGDHLWLNKQLRYVTSHLGQPAQPGHPSLGGLWSTHTTIIRILSLYCTTLQQHVWPVIVLHGWPTYVERLAQRSPQYRSGTFGKHLKMVHL